MRQPASLTRFKQQIRVADNSFLFKSIDGMFDGESSPECIREVGKVIRLERAVDGVC